MLIKLLKILGIWLMAIPEFVAILYIISWISPFLESNSRHCEVNCFANLYTFLQIAFFGSLLISLIWTVVFLIKDNKRHKNIT